MIKRYLLVILSLSLFLSSCVQSPDDMLKQFNDNLYQDIGDGMYQQGDVILNPRLIPDPPMNVFPVIPGGTKRIEVSEEFHSFSWSIINNSTKEEVQLPGKHIVWVGRPNFEFKEGGVYTLVLFARNKEGVLFKDTATIKVVTNK